MAWGQFPLQDDRRRYFSKNTLIIGMDPNISNNLIGGSIEVVFDISSIPANIESANLIITTFRTHGTDYGFNRIDPYPISKWVKELKRHYENDLRIKLAVDSDVVWDVDQISIEDIIYEDEVIKNWVWIVIGALISAGLGIISTILLKVYNIM